MSKDKKKLTNLINSSIDKTINNLSWYKRLSLRYGNITPFTISAGLIINLAIFSLNLFYAIYYSSFWYLTFALYYLIIFLVRILNFISLNKNILKEENVFIKKGTTLYVLIGFILILVGILFGGSIIMIFYIKPPTIKSEIMAISSATYTFFKFVNPIINIKKAKKYDIYLITFRDIGFIDAIESMFILEVSMIYTFGGGFEESMSILFLISGIVASLFTIGMSIYMIRNGLKLKKARN